MLSSGHAFDTYQLYPPAVHPCTVFKRKRYCFVLDKATVHTTTPKTTQQKTDQFENAFQSGMIM